MPQIIVKPLNVLDGAAWNMRTGAPRWDHPLFGDGRANWDPFPAYPHDLATALAAARVVQAAMPPLWDVHVFAADREDTGRMNGYSWLSRRDRFDDAAADWVPTDAAGLIMMGGKRVPPHPGMTAYLVGHEYGHHAEWMINRARGARFDTGQDTAREYLTARGLPGSCAHPGEGGTWHDAVAEILACDFRVLVAGLEPGYWPHPGIPRPEDVPGLDDWWDKALFDVDGYRADHG